MDAVQHTGADYTVTIDVLNEAPDAAAFAAGTPGLFTVLDQFPQTRQDYAHLKQIPSTTKLSTLQIPGNATRRIMVSFAGVAPTGRYAVLWVHGHLLPGTDDSSVCLAAAC